MDISREKTLLLSSHYKRYKTDTPCSFSCHLDSTVDIEDVSRVVVKSVHFPNLFGNVGTWNNKLYFSSGGAGVFVAEVPPGQYDVATFLVALQTAITGAGGTTCTGITQDPLTFRLTISTTDPTSYLSDSSVLARTGSVSSLNNVIGSGSHENTVSATSVALPGILNLCGPTQLHLTSETLGGAHSSDSLGDSRSVVCVIPIDQPFGSTVHWYTRQHLLSFVDYSGDRNLSTIDIRLTTPDDGQLVLPENALVEIELMCVYTT